MKKLLTAAVAASLMTTSALAGEVKIGFITTLTTGGAVIGKDIQKAVDLAVEHMGGKMGDLDINLIYADDGFKPETG
ncbi:MAG: ABC transporter substrate-binding protein, partial [Paracoccaceae bacterium]